jgi:hypothetical protein
MSADIDRLVKLLAGIAFIYGCPDKFLLRFQFRRV